MTPEQSPLGKAARYIEQYDATTVVLPGHAARVDPYLNLVIEPEVVT
jgi:NADPH-dependent 7-cyano-7-deazaguanine reductase QueF-like protein